MKRLLFAVVVYCFAAFPVSGAETIDASWVEREVEFTFFGLDVAYSCDMVEGRIEMLLRHLGAAEIEVSASPCPGYDRPQRRIPITAGFSTLTPAGDGDVDTVRAMWVEVELGDRRPRLIEDGDCELLEQFRKVVLPEVEHVVVDGETGCGAGQASIVGRLRLRILEPVPGDDPPAAGK